LSDKPELRTFELEASLILASGEEKKGVLIHFEPKLQRLALKCEPEGIIYFYAPRISYIRFYRQKDDDIHLPKMANLEKKIVNAVDGKQFLARIVPKKPHEHGFFAFEENKESLFNHYFFYNHGVRNIEHPKLIGQILIDDNVLSHQDINEALIKQKTLHQQRLGQLIVDQKQIVPADVENAVSKLGKKRKHIGQILIEAGLINEDDLQKALSEQAKNRSLKLGQVLIKMGLVTEQELISSLAKKFNLPYVDLNDYVINHKLIELFDMNLLLRYKVLPIASDEETLTIASADPLNFDAFDVLRFQTKKRITEVLATPAQIEKIMGQLLDESATEGEDWLWIQQVSEGADSGTENEAVEIKAAEAQPIVRLLNKILINALHKGASDIHIMPQGKELRILYRINGDLLEVMVLEKWVQRRMISRVKLLSGMNIADHKITQDGRMMVRHEEGVVEFRVSCIPGAYGESIVMRVLNKEMAASIESLGLREADSIALSKIMRKPFGLILATGPTGSGKSTTLFALLQNIIELPLHILTIEDPVESEIPGTNQIQVNTKSGLTFARILRNVLRHDPDVIMVGEMRDKETASIGVEAALTGHLMLSTLHTNSAVDTIIRLGDLGIPNYLLAPALRGVISQNLVKRLCQFCRQPLDDDHDEIYEVLEGMALKRPDSLFRKGGCDKCDETGFSGRVVVYEFLEMTESVRHGVHIGKVGSDLQKIAESEGMIPKAQHALSLAEQGIISRDDLLFMLV